jgi:hypothetical protein
LDLHHSKDSTIGLFYYCPSSSQSSSETATCSSAGPQSRPRNNIISMVRRVMQIAEEKPRLSTRIESSRIHSSSNGLSSRTADLNIDALRIKLSTICRVRPSPQMRQMKSNNLGSYDIFACLQTFGNLDVPRVVIRDKLVRSPEAFVISAIIDPSTLGNLHELEFCGVGVVGGYVIDDRSMVRDWPSASLPPLPAKDLAGGNGSTDVGWRPSFSANDLVLVRIDGIQRVAAEVCGVPAWGVAWVREIRVVRTEAWIVDAICPDLVDMVVSQGQWRESGYES